MDGCAFTHRDPLASSLETKEYDRQAIESEGVKDSVEEVGSLHSTEDNG